ncbi:MAG: hypothetical protein KTR35_09750 [Gammaproteobacteria bacterium]|nr:hypothetical protein [Gammaproteobacteria bacterium]
MGVFVLLIQFDKGVVGGMMGLKDFSEATGGSDGRSTPKKDLSGSDSLLPLHVTLRQAGVPLRV